jgi:hypothetical protein
MTTHPTTMTSARWQERITEPSLTVLVVLEFFAIFVAAPLADMGFRSKAADILLVSLILGAALAVVWRNRLASITIASAFVLGVLTAILRQGSPTRLTISVDFGAKLAFLVTLTWVVGGAVFGPGRVTFHRVRGAVAIYLQISLMFTFLYLMMLRLVPGAFSPAIHLSGPTGDVLRGASGGAQMVYFSLVTITSIGYGDIVPVHPLARSFATMEAVIGQLYPATVLARLVTLELEGRRR